MASFDGLESSRICCIAAFHCFESNDGKITRDLDKVSVPSPKFKVLVRGRRRPAGLEFADKQNQQNRRQRNPSQHAEAVHEREEEALSGYLLVDHARSC